MSCEATATLRQPGYSCGGMPILSPGNDTRINAMLLMTDPARLAKVLANPKVVVPPTDKTGQLVVPFTYDFSGWVEIAQRQQDAANGNASESSAPSDSYADGEGNICRSVASGTQAFNDALAAAHSVPGDEATRLRSARADMANACAANGGSVAWTKPSALKSPVALQYATYLDGAYAFYRHDFANATKAFASVSRSTDPWLKETGLYMAGRAQLNAAQANVFDADTSALDAGKVAKVSLNAADTVFRAYLKVYPQGRYAASAVGLQRRVAWLGSNAAQQADLYDKAFAQWSPNASNVPLGQLANELDSKLLLTTNADPNQIRSPSVLAIVDLMKMRAVAAGDTSAPKPLTLAQLQAQKPRFAAQPALHDYLLASYHVYVDHQPQQALALLPQAPGASLDYFALSQQTLRAFALEDSGQAEQARQLWAQLIPLARYAMQREALELSLAINLEQAGLVDRVFADDSPIQNAAIRATLLERAANADLLRAQAKNPATGGALRDIATYTLLYKELTRARYQDFIADVSLVSDRPSDNLKPFVQTGGAGDAGYACPALRDVAASLQQDGSDPKGLNCLAEFVRRYPPAYGLSEEGLVYGAASQPASGAAAQPPTLGSAPSQFAGKGYQRIGSYQTVIGNAQASADERAYALYRAIQCFAPAGYSECGGNDISKATRKQWFNTLKASYPGTKWARSLKYYW
ncbi:hypothetical protein LFL96_31425 [Paraburkholderia sp. D15]|uniref:hypothetical protein n=1 Tax=Paraburkholderia sp. D15 TaxID=2880218 RepID=UPI0024789F2B|nr:hypothetical protein [Paraburkholderia sp. D15]WGS52697.1 hypothetical protein LFL96_31425 [Paraburkholderia sp. D15]